MSASIPAEPLREAPQDLPSLLALESTLILPHFTAPDAYHLGTSIYHRLRALSSSPAVVNISLANANNLLFHAVSNSGVMPDNDIWVSRKRKTVLRWGMSSLAMRRKIEAGMPTDQTGKAVGSVEEPFKFKYMLGDSAGSYAVHGGGVPVRVRGVEGVVGVVVVSGLKQEEDHMVVVEALEELIKMSGKADDQQNDGDSSTLRGNK